MKRILIAGLLALGAMALSQDTASAQCQSVHGKFCGGFNFVFPRIKFCFDSCPTGCGPAPACGPDHGPLVAPPAHAWYNYWPDGGHGPAPVPVGPGAPGVRPAPPPPAAGPRPASYEPMIAPAAYGPATGAAPYYWYGR